MRTIEFRGKRKTSGNWIYGYYALEKFHNYEPTHAIFDTERNEWREVVPDTVGQFAGLHDRNGAKIYEGDIIADTNNAKYVCVFENGCFDFRDTSGRTIANPIATISVVVGNIFDNKELLKAA